MQMFSLGERNENNLIYQNSDPTIYMHTLVTLQVYMHASVTLYTYNNDPMCIHSLVSHIHLVRK